MSTSERIARSLIAYAARHAPPTLSERLEEEWLADLAARHASLPRLRLALGCCWASSVIAREHGAVSTVAAATAGPGVVTSYPERRPPLLPRRALALSLIAVIHVGLISALASGLLHRIVEAAPEPLQAAVLPPVPRPAPPPPADPKLKALRLVIVDPPPLLPPPPTGGGAIEARLATAPEPPHGPAQPVVNRVLGGPGRGFPHTDDFYPAEAIRTAETGAAAVSVCVDDAGRLTQAPAIEESSGSARLDAGALKLARAGSGHYRPTTEDGRPVNSCYSFRVRFSLRQ